MFELAVLGLLVESDLHGYELKKRLTELLGPWSSVSFGSLYPALARLERDGLVVAAAPSAAPTLDPPPMSGSLGAEVAAYRARARVRGGGGRRARKVYAITPAGREALTTLLDDETGDDRTFAVRVAFCRHLEPAARLALFHRRREAVAQRLAGREGSVGTADLYRRRSREFQDDRLRRELAWLDDLIAAETADHPPGGGTALSTPGGTSS
jgi:DNA-binding PadR family transcriptional regulator